MAGYCLDQLARFCADTAYEALPPDVVHQIKRAVVDCVGSVLGAWRVGVSRDLIPVIRGLGGASEATIWGDGGMAAAPYAALAVGTIGSHLEYASHSDVIPAAFAVAEMRRGDGRTVITALAAAFGVAAAVKRLLAAGIEAHGLHWPGHLSAYSAAAAASRVEGKCPDRIAAALSLAGCLAPVAPFEAFTKGAAVKDLYGGWGGMLGVMAARLSSAGFAGPTNLFEGSRGIGRTWLDRVPSPDDLAAALAVARSCGISQLCFKPFASCVSAHPVLSALEELRGQHPDLDVDGIVRVEVGTYAYASRLSGESSADTPISARVNLPYLCAALLSDGVVGAEQAEEPRLSDPRVRELADRVSVFEMPGTDVGLEARERPASVSIVMRDGRRLEASVGGPKWGQDAPASDADLEHKFRCLVGDLMTPTRRETLLHMLWQLESVPDIRDVVAYLVPV